MNDKPVNQDAMPSIAQGEAIVGIANENQSGKIGMAESVARAVVDEVIKANKLPLTFETLIGQQIPRYHSMVHRYGEKTVVMLDHIKRSGPNSWNNFVPLSEMVNNSTGNERLHFQALTDEFELNQPITIEAVVLAVCELLARFKYPPIPNNINALCLQELRKVFMLEEEMVPKPNGKGNHRVYIPVFAILAD